MAGIGIIRMSGPDALAITRRVFCPSGGKCEWKSHHLYHGDIVAADGETILALRAVARQVPVAQAVQDFALRLLVSTHPEREDAPEIARKYLRFGASPRAAQAMIAAARVRALKQGRYNAAFDDIRFVAPACLRHRLALNFEALSDGVTVDQVISRLIEEAGKSDA